MLLEHLRGELENRSRKNPRYSVRAFARSLRIDSSTLSALLNGKRPVTAQTAKRILEELDIDPSLKNHILLSTIKANEKRADNFLLVPNDALELIGGWEHYAILSLLEVSGFKATATAIANRLNISTGVAISALKRLEKLEMVKRGKHCWSSAGKQLETTTDVPSFALRKANREYIEKALSSLEQHSVDERDISGITMAISTRKLPEAKRIIREFRQSLSQFLESGEKNEVYRLNVQLFPLKK